MKMLTEAQLDALRGTYNALQELTRALDGAFISSWQSTAAWDEELKKAKEALEAVDHTGAMYD